MPSETNENRPLKASTMGLPRTIGKTSATCASGSAKCSGVNGFRDGSPSAAR